MFGATTGARGVGVCALSTVALRSLPRDSYILAINAGFPAILASRSPSMIPLSLGVNACPSQEELLPWIDESCCVVQLAA